MSFLNVTGETKRRIMVTCAGPQDKWNGHLGVPSHLVRDNTGEPILYRTLRQLRERGYGTDDVFVFHPNVAGYFRPGNTSVVVPAGKYRTEFHTTREWWLEEESERNILLLGDTWFTDEALDEILGHDGYLLRFFGRENASKVTGSPYGELLGYSWRGNGNSLLDRGMLSLSGLKDKGLVWRYCGWEQLYWTQGDKLKTNRHFTHRCDPEWFTEIDDLSDDIDFPKDYLRHPMFGKGH